IGWLTDRVPERNRRPVPQLGQVLPIDIDDSAVVPDAGCRFFGRGKVPNEPAGEDADERMIEVALAPGLERPAFLKPIEAAEPFALGRQHLLNVLDTGLQILQCLRVLRGHYGWDRFLRLAVTLNPE